MMSLFRFTLILALSTVAITAQAADCQSAVTQADMNACAARDLAEADAELNKLYVDYRARLNHARQNQIRDVQLAWIKYRDLSCRFQSSAAAGGSAANYVLSSCRAEKTRTRVQELKALSTCQEGDVSCVR